jgi:hypothetical protein
MALHLIDPDTGASSDPNACWVFEVLKWPTSATTTRRRHKPLVHREFHPDEVSARAARRKYLEAHPAPLTVIVSVRPWISPATGGSTR